MIGQILLFAAVLYFSSPDFPVREICMVKFSLYKSHKIFLLTLLIFLIFSCFQNYDSIMKNGHLLAHRIPFYIRAALSEHVSIEHLKKMAFVLALFSCLSGGSVMLFSFFASSLHDLLGISYFFINVIASACAIGLYFCLPVLGYLGDCYGPSLLSMILVVLFVPSYFTNGQLVQKMAKSGMSTWHSYCLGLTFFMIGLATSSLYFLCLLTCAKIYPERKGLAISLPVSCYGLSSLLGSQLMKLLYFSDGSRGSGGHGGGHGHGHGNQEEHLNLTKVFNFFGVLYLVVGLLGTISSSIVVMESDVLFTNESDYEYDELDQTPLLASSNSRHSRSTSTLNEDESYFLPPRSMIEPPNHRERYGAFLRDPSVWLLMFSLFLNIGPLESFQNNLGSIISTTRHDHSSSGLSDQVSFLAASSTVTRLGVGWLSDYMLSADRKHPWCRVNLLFVNVAAGMVGLALISGKADFSWVSVLVGSSYGGLFTIYPTIVASVWGIDIMGSTWGTFMVAPALGSIVYSLLYGHLVDASTERRLGPVNAYFSAVILSLCVSALMVFVVWRHFWSRRGLKVF